MALGIVIGTVASSSILAGGHTAWTTAQLGATLVIYAGFTLLARQLTVSGGVEKWLSPLIGLVTGAVTGGTGVFVIPAVPYLQALELSKDDLIQGLGLSFTVSTIALAVGLACRGALQDDSLAMSSLAIAPGLLGMWLGQAIRSRVSPMAFRRGFLSACCCSGLSLSFGQFSSGRALLKPRGNLPLRHILSGVPDCTADVVCRCSCRLPEPFTGHLRRTLMLNSIRRLYANTVRVNHTAAQIARVRHKGCSGLTCKQITSARPPAARTDRG